MVCTYCMCEQEVATTGVMLYSQNTQCWTELKYAEVFRAIIPNWSHLG